MRMGSVKRSRHSSSGDFPTSAPANSRRPLRSSALIVTIGIFALLVVIAFGLLAFAGSRGAVDADAAALAHVALPLTGGSIESVTVVGPHGRTIPVTTTGGSLWPKVALAPGEPVTIDVDMRHAGWVAWLAGSRESIQLRLRTPSAAVSDRYLTLANGAPLRLAFDQSVSKLAYGQPEHLRRRTLQRPLNLLTLPRRGPAGSIEVAAAPRRWESLPKPLLVSWFPAGADTSAVLSPAPGTTITPATPISLTFSKTVSAALGGAQPHLTPATSGSWRPVDSHTIVFRPDGYGYGLDTQVSLALPHTVQLVGAGREAEASSVATWTVPPGSSLRAQQILAQLGYLPLEFSSDHAMGLTAAAQESAAIHPPTGSFSWRYPNTPSSLQGLWQPGSDNVVMRGALMAFENAHELTTDGIAGPEVWHALIHAAIAGDNASGGYSYVMVSESSQSLALWHDGSIRITTPVNTGIAAAPTELGTFPVYEHIPSGTMSGTNPDGSHYEDPGVPWISYFNGGDALHGFERAQYGFPQSLGCVEMPPGTAGEVWPYTPIGTLVHID